MRFLTRLLQLLLVVVSLLAVFFWFAARRGDRGSIEEEITIDRPAPEVFRWITSDELLRRWISDVTKLETLSPGAATTAISRTVQVEQLIAGRQVRFEFKLAQVAPNQLASWQFRSTAPEGGVGVATFRLLPNGDYTRLTFSSHTQFVSATDQILEPILTYAAKRKLHEDLFKLKLLIEGESAPR